MKNVLTLASVVALLVPLGSPQASNAARPRATGPIVPKHCSTVTRGSPPHGKGVRVCRWTALVSGRSDVYGAGHATLPPVAGGGGDFPPELKFRAGPGKTLTFPAVSGSVTAYPNETPTGAAGDRSGDTDITGLDGLSGIIDHTDAAFLVGVFLTSRAPTDPSPPSIDFTGSETFTRLHPSVRQVFFIGDGIRRRIVVPSKATRLYLGFADGYNFQGAPGFYDDNVGRLTVALKMTGS